MWGVEGCGQNHRGPLLTTPSRTQWGVRSPSRVCLPPRLVSCSATEQCRKPTQSFVVIRRKRSFLRIQPINLVTPWQPAEPSLPDLRRGRWRFRVTASSQLAFGCAGSGERGAPSRRFSEDRGLCLACSSFALRVSPRARETCPALCSSLSAGVVDTDGDPGPLWDPAARAPPLTALPSRVLVSESFPSRSLSSNICGFISLHSVFVFNARAFW